MNISTSCEKDDVYWTMTWGKNYPDKPETELIFDDNRALAMLLINDVIFLNDHWWETTWPDNCKAKTSLNVNTNDIFMWGCADAETIDYKDIKEVYDYWLKDPYWGTAVWACKRNNMLPQKPVYNDIQKAGIWDLDSMGLSVNPTWK